MPALRKDEGPAEGAISLTRARARGGTGAPSFTGDGAALGCRRVDNQAGLEMQPASVQTEASRVAHSDGPGVSSAARVHESGVRHRRGSYPDVECASVSRRRVDDQALDHLEAARRHVHGTAISPSRRREAKRAPEESRVAAAHEGHPAEVGRRRVVALAVDQDKIAPAGEEGASERARARVGEGH
eukprot:1675750-Prymnesium_polylepis.1